MIGKDEPCPTLQFVSNAMSPQVTETEGDLIYVYHRHKAGVPVFCPLEKEVIQPQVPLRLPCYDLVPITKLAVGAYPPEGWTDDFRRSWLSWLDGRCVQGSGTYSPQCG